MIAPRSDGGFHEGYRSVFQIELRRSETAVEVAGAFFRDWLRTRKRHVDSNALDGWDGRSELTLPSGARIKAFEFQDERSGVRAARYIMIDAADVGQYRVRLSATSVRGRKAPVGGFVVDAARSSGTQDEAIRMIAPPRLIPEILEQRRVFDASTRLQGQPRVIHSADVHELVEAIADQSRLVDLVVASSLGPESDERWREVVTLLTRGTVGVAATYFVADDAVDEMNSLLPAALRTQRGHLRTVAPRVNFENPDAKRHPLLSPEYLADALGSGGEPTGEAVSEVAYDPRLQLLDSPLPTYVRRSMELLDKEERDARLQSEVELQVEEQLLEANRPVLPQAGEGLRAYPKRRHHHKHQASQDFWQLFQQGLSRWIGKPAELISEETLEVHMRELDRRVTQDRAELTLVREALSQAEDQNSALRFDVASLREEAESLGLQLEASEAKLSDAIARVRELEAQLSSHDLTPVQQVAAQPSSNGRALYNKLMGEPDETLSPRREVDELLVLLANRLGPLLQKRLEPVLDGAPWTDVLAALDEKRGRLPGRYELADPSAQLRMLTQRLGDLGYPFDPAGKRDVSAYAQELLSLRHAHAHHVAVESEVIVRAYETLSLLLQALGDEGGARVAQERHAELLWITKGAFAPHIGDVGQDSQDAVKVEGDGGAAADTGRQAADQDAAVHPSPRVLEQEVNPVGAMLGTQRPQYEAWQVRGTGTVETLNSLNRPREQERVRAVVEEIAEFEGPILLSRLVSLVAAEFGLGRVSGSRQRQIESQARKASVTVDDDGFVWPQSLEARSWQEFRPNSSGAGREFTSISPVEIRNAARFLSSKEPELSDEELEVQVLQTFGRKRRTAPVIGHLRRSLD